MNRIVLTGAVLVGALATATVARASAITNGGFETGSFNGWTVETAASGSLLLIGGHAHSGADAAWFGSIGTHDDSLSQTFATVAGESYLLTFWLSHGATDTANDFNVWWDSTPLLSLNNAPKFKPRHYTFVLTADDDQTTLRFSGRELADYYVLDDVGVAPIPTPEPTSVALLLSGIAFGLFSLRYRA